MAEQVTIFIDYQNVHLTAHDLFARPGDRLESSLVHPVRLAERLVSARTIDSELRGIRIFRGRPNPAHHPVPTAANDAQTAAWQRDPRLRRRESQRPRLHPSSAAPRSAPSS